MIYPGASRLVSGKGSRALFGPGREAELVSNFCRRAQKLGYVGGHLWGALETISFDPSPAPQYQFWRSHR